MCESRRALEQARYEAGHARRQYDAVDPDNRLVAAELERRWNESLAVVARREAKLAAAAGEREECAADTEREQLLAVGGGADRRLAGARPGLV
jgi:hypothetical protein